MTDPRRGVPRTDTLLADPRLVAAAEKHGRAAVRDLVHAVQQQVREGALAPGDAADAAADRVSALAAGPRPVINATGVVLHTNLGRAPLSPAALDALVAAAGYVDVEFDLATGRRARRGRDALTALLAAVPEAGDALVVNNGAAALLLAVTALAGGGEVVVSRGELIEIGDGFRLPDLIESAGARIREVGTTNRTTAADYAAAVGPQTGCLLRIHPSNFRIEGFTGAPGLAELAAIGPPVVADIGSGLLAPLPVLPDEPDARSWLRAGASVVTGSGDKLLGGPQAGLLLGAADLVQRCRRHPLARALRADKLTLAALAATVTGAPVPVQRYLTAETRSRTEALAAEVGGTVVAADGVVGGGGGPGVVLPGWAVALPERLAAPLRTGTPPVVGRIENGVLLLDLRCVEPADDARIAAAVRAVL
jgi:L-seryl-tRNA(Ser) seleniumtransferase